MGKSISTVINLGSVGQRFTHCNWHTLLITERYGEYPQPPLGSSRSAESMLPNMPVKSTTNDSTGLPRRSSQIKIESPSVIVAAKKTALEKIDDEDLEPESSVTSDEDTLVCKSKSGKSNVGE